MASDNGEITHWQEVSARLIKIGQLKERLIHILERPLFDNCGSKHDFECWKGNLEDSDEINDHDLLYDLHMKVRFLKDDLWDLISLIDG